MPEHCSRQFSSLLQQKDERSRSRRSRCVVVYLLRVGGACGGVYVGPSVQTKGVWNMSLCSLLAPVCVLVKMKVTQTASQRCRPLRLLHPSSLPSWQPSSLLPMTMRRMPGVAMSTKCCQIQMVPALFTPSTCSPGSSR